MDLLILDIDPGGIVVLQKSRKNPEKKLFPKK